MAKILENIVQMATSVPRRPTRSYIMSFTKDSELPNRGGGGNASLPVDHPSPQLTDVSATSMVVFISVSCGIH
jgi:hypothetical protein